MVWVYLDDDGELQQVSAPPYPVNTWMVFQ